jgi:hypothetical protein
MLDAAGRAMEDARMIIRWVADLVHVMLSFPEVLMRHVLRADPGSLLSRVRVVRLGLLLPARMELLGPPRICHLLTLSMLPCQLSDQSAVGNLTDTYGNEKYPYEKEELEPSWFAGSVLNQL